MTTRSFACLAGQLQATKSSLRTKAVDPALDFWADLPVGNAPRWLLFADIGRGQVTGGLRLGLK